MAQDNEECSDIVHIALLYDKTRHPMCASRGGENDISLRVCVSDLKTDQTRNATRKLKLQAHNKNNQSKSYRLLIPGRRIPPRQKSDIKVKSNVLLRFISS